MCYYCYSRHINLNLPELRFTQYILWSVISPDSQSCMLNSTSTFSSHSVLYSAPEALTMIPLHRFLHRQFTTGLDTTNPKPALHSQIHTETLVHTRCPHWWPSSCHGQRHGDRQYLRWPYPERAAFGFIRRELRRRRKRNISLLCTDRYLSFFVISLKPVWPVTKLVGPSLALVICS